MLRFGTAGLRAPLGEGPDRMNVDTVTRATAGLAAWLTGHGYAGRLVVVGYDARHGSATFARATAEVLVAADFEVALMSRPVPTPAVAFAVRWARAAAGVQITASHNPPTDNGYKVYLEGGAQIVAPVDAQVEAAMAAAPRASDVPRAVVPPAVAEDEPDASPGGCRSGDALYERYLRHVSARTRGPGGSGPGPAAGLRVALTAMHGVGGAAAARVLTEAGAEVLPVTAQFAPDPDFPTVASPNPEEPAACALLLAHAAATAADLALALDPDADRCAVGIPRPEGGWRILTGDETGALIADHLLRGRKPESDEATPVVATTLVSSTLLPLLAAARGARGEVTGTGFKWLARAGGGPDGDLLFAYEEAIGYCVDPRAVPDKDGISAAGLLAVLAASRPLDRRLADLEAEFGTFRTTQIAVRLDDPARAVRVIDALRSDPPAALAGLPCTCADLPGMAGMRIAGASPDEARRVRVVVRPSGTEPKLKFYLEAAVFPAARTEAEQMLTALRAFAVDAAATP